MNFSAAKAVIFVLIIGIIISACSSNLWGNLDLYQTPGPGTATILLDPAAVHTPTLTPSASKTRLPTLDNVTKIASPSQPPTPTPQVFVPTTSPGTIIPYTSQSGDSLNVIAIHFGIQPYEITSSAPLSAEGFINPGTLIFLPPQTYPGGTTPSTPIIPDSELVDSPSAVGFDVDAYIHSAGGRLSTYVDYHTPVGTISGAESVRMLSVGSSISPRLLLAIIEYYTGWVKGQSKPGLDEKALFGDEYSAYNPATPTLYQPLRLVVQDLLTGYYGWRSGSIYQVTFPDGMNLRIAPELNAGSVAIQYFFSKHLNYSEWLQAIDPDAGFLSLYNSMFGDPWIRANELGPLFPPNLIQPTFTLPFEVNRLWAFTGGPHPAWEAESAWGALDFAPAAAVSGCSESNAWVVAIAPGEIVRSESSYVVLDLDGDGFEQTGWVVIYQHVGSKDRIPAGKWVNAGDLIGHPSCEGGTFTGTNLHIARKYNGEWVGAGDPLPFVMSGWTAHYGSAPYLGTLTKGDKTITANQTGVQESQITRLPGE